MHWVCGRCDSSLLPSSHQYHKVALVVMMEKKSGIHVLVCPLYRLACSVVRLVSVCAGVGPLVVALGGISIWGGVGVFVVGVSIIMHVRCCVCLLLCMFIVVCVHRCVCSLLCVFAIVRVCHCACSPLLLQL